MSPGLMVRSGCGLLAEVARLTPHTTPFSPPDRVPLTVACSNVSQKAGLNRSILGHGWGLLVARLEQKAPGRVEKINPAYTSARCSACGQVAAASRENQSRCVCVACGHTAHADVNAAINIAEGRAVSARGGDATRRPVNREPQRAAPLS